MGIETAIAGGAALGGLMGSKKSGTQTSTQTSAPWEVQQPYLKTLFSGAQNTLNNGYQGPMLAPGATSQLQDTIGGKYLNPSSNPFLQNYVNDALGLAKSQFAGQYGGQAGGNLGNSGYQEMLTRTLANTALPIYANAYNTERQNQLNASQLAPSIDVANMQSPFAPLQAYQGLVGGSYGGTSTTQQPFYTNPAAGALGGALAGGQIFGMLNQPRAGMSSTPFGGGFGWGNV